MSEKRERMSSMRVLAAITDEGLTAKEIAGKLGMDPTAVRKPIARLFHEGHIHKAKFSSVLVWYFRSEAAAKAFTTPVRLKPAGFSPPKTKTGFDRGAKVVRPDHVKVQKCPGFQGLGFAAPAKPADGSFAALGVGRYLPDEDAMLRRMARKGAR
jgi:hypothetical protein